MASKKRDSSKPKHSDLQLHFFPAWCKRCGNCVELCPKKVWTADEWGYPQVTRPEECILCGMCEKLCPDFAITVGEKTPREPQARPTTPRMTRGRSPERVAQTSPTNEEEHDA